MMIFHQILLLQFIDTQKWAIEPKSTHENDYIHIAQNCLAMKLQNTLLSSKSQK